MEKIVTNSSRVLQKNCEFDGMVCYIRNRQNGLIDEEINLETPSQPFYSKLMIQKRFVYFGNTEIQPVVGGKARNKYSVRSGFIIRQKWLNVKFSWFWIHLKRFKCFIFLELPVVVLTFKILVRILSLSLSPLSFSHTQSLLYCFALLFVNIFLANALWYNCIYFFPVMLSLPRYHCVILIRLSQIGSSIPFLFFKMGQSRPLFMFIFVFSTCHNLNSIFKLINA